MIDDRATDIINPPEKLSAGKLNMNSDRHPIPQRPISRIGLLSPTSGNLGNAAMQSAMIANLRKRIADVEILGITLNPDDTRRRHGIETFPLAGVSRPFYGLFNSEGSEAGRRQTQKPARIKQWLKTIPMLRGFVRAIRMGALEFAHFAAAARTVRKLDRIIIPGGGALDDFWGGPWGHPWVLFKWSVLSRIYGVPFLFVSIGKSSVKGPLSRFFARTALRLAAYRSYRDQESKIAVQTLIDARNDPVFPDLAFSYPCPSAGTSRGIGSQDGRLVIGVSPIAYCDPRTWPHQDEQRYTMYVSQLTALVRWLLKEGHQVMFFTTDAPDAATVNDIQSMLAGSTIDSGAIQTLAASTEQSPNSLLQGISRADLTIASRLHGVILSHLNSTPVLALSFDPKVDAHMNAMGQQDYCLDIDHLQLEPLVERFNALKILREKEAAHIRCTALAFRRQLDIQYDRIVGGLALNLGTGHDQDQVNASTLPEIDGLRTR